MSSPTPDPLPSSLATTFALIASECVVATLIDALTGSANDFGSLRTIEAIASSIDVGAPANSFCAPVSLTYATAVIRGSLMNGVPSGCNVVTPGSDMRAFAYSHGMRSWSSGVNMKITPAAPWLAAFFSFWTGDA